jgi:hypothetical protein
MSVATRSVLHKRLTTFVIWVAPDSSKLKEIGDRANEIRSRIKEEATRDGLTICSMPKAGSFEKKTGLRRHYRGSASVDGLDVDIPIVVEPKDVDEKKVVSLLDKFERYAKKCYPSTTLSRTKKSVKLIFSDKTVYELVPMLSTGKDNEQLIIPSKETSIKTSVQKHNEFIKSRIRASDESAGRVLFNECIRLVKWWREIQANDSYYLSFDEEKSIDNRPPSAMLEWLCANAFDKYGVKETYHETFALWFGYFANVVRNRKPVFSTDYYSNPQIPSSAKWAVLDPVNASNNIVSSWEETKINEFATWCEEARDKWVEIIQFNEEGDDAKSMSVLVELFGTPFKNHSN